jgi:hypothetical protein
MFFRRERTHNLTFEERLRRASDAGFRIETEGAGRARIVRDGCAAILLDVPGERPRVENAGILLGGEIGKLVDGGFQKFLLAPSGRKTPALASHLKTLHAFQEDLREALGLEALYNEALGTTNDSHVYDRVTGRDEGVSKRPWERQ